MEYIESKNNTLIKYLYKLYTNSKLRKEKKEAIVEGKKEINQFFSSQNKIDKEVINIIVSKKIINDNFFNFLQKNSAKDKFIFVSDKIYNKICYRENSGGALIYFRYNINKNKISTCNELIVLDNLEKPGNIGAIIRTGVCFGLKNYVFYNEDIYNPNIIRASLGGIFLSKTFVYKNTTDLIVALEKNNYTVYISHLNGKKFLDNNSFEKKFAIVLGSENKGVSLLWKNCKKKIFYKIPQENLIDSINVSNAFAITGFEIYKQKIK